MDPQGVRICRLLNSPLEPCETKVISAKCLLSFHLDRLIESFEIALQLHFDFVRVPYPFEINLILRLQLKR
jgi:hypothetical protein